MACHIGAALRTDTPKRAVVFEVVASCSNCRVAKRLIIFTGKDNSKRFNSTLEDKDWMWMASFSRSSQCLLSWSTTVVSSHLMGCWCFCMCSATADIAMVPSLHAL